MALLRIESHEVLRKQDAAELEQLQRDIDSLDTVEAPAAQATQPPSTTDPGDLSTLGANTPQQSPSVGVPQSVQAQETSTDTSKDNIAPVEENFKRDSTGLYTSSVFSISPRSVIQLGR